MTAGQRKKGVRSSQKVVADRHRDVRLAAEQGQGDLASWICDQYGFSTKTARRDLHAIKTADPAWWSKNISQMRGLINGRSQTDGHTPERPELQEAIAGVVVLEKLTGGMLSIARADTSRAARQTERLLTAKDEANVKLLRRFIQLRHQPTRTTEQQTTAFTRIVEAHLQGVAIDITYSAVDEPQRVTTSGAAGKATKAAPRRLVGPICLFHAKRAWYLLGKVLDGRSKGELRQFKLARISRSEITTNTFKPPTDFDLNAHLQGAWELFSKGPGRDQHIPIEIEFDALMSKNILETMWHTTQETAVLANGSLRFRATVNGYDEILWWILQMGSHARVIKPEDLRQRVVAELKNMQKLYA